MINIDPKQDPHWIKSLGYFGVIIGEIMVCSGLGIGLGYLAWKKWDAPWWVLLLSSMAGLTLAFYRLYRMILKDVDAEK